MRLSRGHSESYYQVGFAFELVCLRVQILAILEVLAGSVGPFFGVLHLRSQRLW